MDNNYYIIIVNVYLMNKKLILEFGKKFGKWKIISNETIRKNNLTHWLCECECGKEEYVPLNNLMNSSSTQCFDCASKTAGKKRRKGVGLISGDFWSQYKAKVKRKDLPFDIRIEEEWAKFEVQEGLCALTKRKLVLTGYPYDKEKTTAALSLVEPKVGYVSNNIVWLHKEIDKIKGKLSIYKLYDIASEIVE